MKEKSIVEFEAITFTENGTGYASAFAFNGLYEIDIEKKKCKWQTLIQFSIALQFKNLFHSNVREIYLHL